MTQDRSTPLESVVEDWRRRARDARVSAENLARSSGPIKVRELAHREMIQRAVLLDALADELAQALSTQPHQERKGETHEPGI